MEDAELITEFLKTKSIDAYNTRTFKTVENGTTVYEVNRPFLFPSCKWKGLMND